VAPLRSPALHMPSQTPGRPETPLCPALAVRERWVVKTRSSDHEMTWCHCPSLRFDPEPFHTRESGDFGKLSKRHAATDGTGERGDNGNGNDGNGGGNGGNNNTYLRCICNGATGARELARLGGAWTAALGDGAAPRATAGRTRGLSIFLSKPRAYTNLHYDRRMHSLMYQARECVCFVSDENGL